MSVKSNKPSPEKFVPLITWPRMNGARSPFHNPLTSSKLFGSFKGMLFITHL